MKRKAKCKLKMCKRAKYPEPAIYWYECNCKWKSVESSDVMEVFQIAKGHFWTKTGKMIS